MTLHESKIQLPLSQNRASAVNLYMQRFQLRKTCYKALSTVVALTTLFAVAACHRSSVPATTVVAIPAPLHDARLPELLNDSEYWQIITDFSEPSGFFQSENFVSNEMGLQYVIDDIKQSVQPGGVYVGVGPEQNFTYIAALKPRIAFIVDIRRQNLLQHLWYKAVFELSPNRVSFVSRLFGRVAPVTLNANSSIDSILLAFDKTPRDTAFFRRTFDEVRTHLVSKHGFSLDSADIHTLRYIDSIFFTNGPTLNYSSGDSRRVGGMMRSMPSFSQIVRATDEIGENHSFLGSASAYSYVREMQRRNLIIPIVGNFSGPHAIRSVGRWLGERGATVSVYYCSNVEQYLFQSDEWVRFYRNVSTMPLDSTSTFVRSIPNRLRFVGPQSTMMMSQLTSPMSSMIRDVNSGLIQSYTDVIVRSK